MGKERGREVAVSTIVWLHVVILYVDEMNNTLDSCNQLVLLSGYCILSYGCALAPFLAEQGVPTFLVRYLFIP